jgi:hypothetical protein
VITESDVAIVFPGARAIPGYHDMFATPEGKIISTRRGRPRERKVYTFRGHRRVNIRQGPKVEPARVAQLICATFHGPRPNPDHEAIHVNGNRTDNAADNVKWALPDERIAGQVERGTQVRGERHPRHKLTEVEVLEIKALSVQGHTRNYLAERFHVCASNIGFIVSGKTWKHLIDAGTGDGNGPQELAEGATEYPEGRSQTFP